jgi:hypothetical protein
MTKFTCTLHGDQANALVLYWNKQYKREAKARQWFMAAMALGCLLEAWLAAVRRLAYEAADCGLLSADLAAGIRRVKGAKRLGMPVGNWLPRSRESAFCGR